jgi:hypothetical protein
MHVTELAIHKTLGIQLAAAGDAHILTLPESPLLLNHLGTVHAGVQFMLAEACSGEFLMSFWWQPSRGIRCPSRVQHKVSQPRSRGIANLGAIPESSRRLRQMSLHRVGALLLLYLSKSRTQMTSSQ